MDRILGRALGCRLRAHGGKLGAKSLDFGPQGLDFPGKRRRIGGLLRLGRHGSHHRAGADRYGQPELFNHAHALFAEFTPSAERSLSWFHDSLMSPDDITQNKTVTLNSYRLRSSE